MLRPWVASRGRSFGSLAFAAIIALGLGPATTPCAGQEGAEFLRGDANGDGVVSLADTHFLGKYLFIGGTPPGCLDAADTDDNGKINITDEVHILDHLAEGVEIPAPYPNPGLDPTGDEDGALDCENYGAGDSIVDPAARLEVLDAEVAGGSDGIATLTVRVSSSFALAGLSGRIATSGGPIREFVGHRSRRGGIPEDLTGLESADTFSYVGVNAGYLSFGYLRTAPDVFDDPLPPGDDQDVIEIAVCLEGGTPAGTYPIELRSGELVEDASASVIEPDLVAGTITVLEDVAEEPDCYELIPGEPGEPQICPPPVGDPTGLQARFRLGEASVVPGGETELPFEIYCNAETQAYAISVDYDEEVLQGVRVERSFAKPDGSEYGYWFSEIIDVNETPGNGGVDEGFVIAAAVFSFEDHCNNLPANVDAEALKLVFRARTDAPPGPTEVRFLDGAQGSGLPVPNVMTALGTAVDPETAGSFVFVNGRVHILPDGTMFIRGDTNQDGTVDLSDAVATLDHLFTARFEASCLDAADADDDGRVLITDPIRTLQYLFQGGAALPPPFEAEGTDPTEDDLTCLPRL